MVAFTQLKMYLNIDVYHPSCVYWVYPIPVINLAANCLPHSFLESRQTASAASANWCVAGAPPSKHIFIGAVVKNSVATLNPAQSD